MEYHNLIVEKEGPLTLVTLNRPEVRNALDMATWREIDGVIGELEADSQVRVVIITGAGEKAFAAGADIRFMRERSMLETFRGEGQRILSRWETMDKVTIAAINGFALGGGCEMAMACTLRVAAESARLRLPEVKLGIIPGYAGTQRLSRLVGKGRAFELILTGEPITAQEAYRIGLVNQVTAAKDLIPMAEALARKILANGPVAVRLALEAVHHGMEMTQQEGEFLEATLFGLCCTTADMKEGTRAFLEKRPPKFTGR